MAKVELENPVKNVKGKLNKRQKDVYRVKQFRSPTGAVIAEGKQEVYHIQYPRNYKLSPVTEKEKAHQDLFAKACKLATAQLQPDAPELPKWVARFEAQRKKPEALNPAQPPKTYKSFRAFVRTAIFFQLKNEQS